ncbi:MAG: ABC transporter permease [Bauldia sp.]|nr:ABC transporter permease [Bauldia sp.]
MIGPLTQVFRALVFVLIGLILCGIIFEFAGYSAWLMFQSIAEGAFLSARAWQNSLRWALPLFLTATGVVISFRCGFFNIGAQGQFYMGAIAATFVVDGLTGYPPALVIPLTFLAGIVGGAVWALWPGLLRVRSGTDEVITTLMGNFLAGLFLVYVTSGPLKDPSGTGQAASSRPVEAIYRIGAANSLSPAIIAICVLVGIGAWVLVNRTSFGVLSSLAGRNPIMVVWQGARLSRLGLAGFVLGGALAGLAGTIEVMGPIGRLSSGMLPTHGFTAILIALVANLSILATAFVSVFFGGLAAAGLYLPVLAGLPAAAIDIINAAIALFITARAWPKRLTNLFRSRRSAA